MEKHEILSNKIKNIKTGLSEGPEPQFSHGGQRGSDMIQLAQGQYMSAPEWAELNPADKHLARIIAHARALRDPVFSHRSAAIIHGIQTLNVPDKLQVLGSGGATNSGLQYRQDKPSHRATILTGPGGLRVVDPVTATIGSVRDTDFAEAMVIAESALRSFPELTHTELHDSLMAVRRSRGSKNAHRVAAAMSPLSASPAETLARVALLNLGLEPVQQYQVSTPLQTFRVGAALVEHGVVVEVVGAPGHAPPQDVSLQDTPAQKAREEAIRGEGWDFVYLTWADVRYRTDAVERKLRSKGVI